MWIHCYSGFLVGERRLRAVIKDQNSPLPLPPPPRPPPTPVMEAKEEQVLVEGKMGEVGVVDCREEEEREEDRRKMEKWTLDAAVRRKLFLIKDFYRRKVSRHCGLNEWLYEVFCFKEFLTGF